jgi:putative two-component system response regulator
LDICKKIRSDLVLLDLNMIDDFQVMEQHREAEKGSYVPILVLTTQSDRNIRFNALAAGARDFVEKIFYITEVLPRISNMLEIRLLDNQVRDQNQIL